MIKLNTVIKICNFIEHYIAGIMYILISAPVTLFALFSWKFFGDWNIALGVIFIYGLLFFDLMLILVMLQKRFDLEYDYLEGSYVVREEEYGVKE